MEISGFATPANVTGMGDPVAPADTTVGSGDIVAVGSEKPKKRKMKSLKKYLKLKRVG